MVYTCIFDYCYCYFEYHIKNGVKERHRQLKFVGKVEKKYCYALVDFERLFYRGFRSKNNDCCILYHYHKNKEYVRNGSDYIKFFVKLSLVA